MNKEMIYNISKEQLILNKQLFDACMKDKIDLIEIKDLINHGANPLGLYDFDDVVYSRIIYWRSHDDDSDNSLYEITKLFLECGMQIKEDNLYKEDGGRGVLFLDPFWEVGYLSPVKAISIIDLLINENTEINRINELVGHLATDSMCIKSELEEVAIYVRILMYLATIPYVLKKSDYLRDVIDYKKNNYDINIFKKLDNYYIKFDESNVSSCNNYGLIILFYTNTGDELIWKIVFE